MRTTGHREVMALERCMQRHICEVVALQTMNRISKDAGKERERV
jgi:hypothetical protein